MDLTRALNHLLTAAPEAAPVADIDAWWARHAALAATFTAPIERALIAAFGADRLGYAFASGFIEALAAVFPDGGHRPRALCASEEGGAHPRAIRATLTPAGAGFRLSGAKQWTTLGTCAEELLVIARLPGARDGHPILACARVPASREGVTVTAMEKAPFCPEIPHARVRFDDVAIAGDERLPGDAYTDLLKPFRTIEDLYVHASTLAWLAQLARRCAWPPEVLDEILALAAAAAALAGCDPSSPAVHRGLAPVIAGLRGIVERSELAQTLDPETAARLARDRPLLDIAQKARARRLERARGG